MTVRRFLRHVGVGVMLAGLALAIAVVALPPGAIRWLFDRPGRVAYLQSESEALALGIVASPPSPVSPLVPSPKRSANFHELMTQQFTTQSFSAPFFPRSNSPTGWGRWVLGVGVLQLETRTTAWTPPSWSLVELRLPAWLLALPGVIWLSLRVRRKIVNRSRPTGFDVLPAREGDG